MRDPVDVSMSSSTRTLTRWCTFTWRVRLGTRKTIGPAALRRVAAPKPQTCVGVHPDQHLAREPAGRVVWA